MSEHTPIAKRIEAEVNSFADLWRKRRWLAILTIVGLVGFIAWSLYTAQTPGGARSRPGETG